MTRNAPWTGDSGTTRYPAVPPTQEEKQMNSMRILVTGTGLSIACAGGRLIGPAQAESSAMSFFVTSVDKGNGAT